MTSQKFPSETAQLSQQLGRRLTALTFGMDQYERQQSGGEGPLDSEGLVPIYLGQSLVPPKQLGSWEDAEVELQDLTLQTQALPDGARKVFLSAMIRSLEAATELFQGRELSYGDKLVRLVGVPNQPVDKTLIAELQAQLDTLLSGLGYVQGTLRDRVERWEQERVVPQDELVRVVDELMTEAKTRTERMICPTGDYTMVLEPVRNVPYTARCNFTEGKMDLNLDLGFSRSSLKHLVAHEVFPGHATQLLYTLNKAETGESTVDVLLCTTNGATGAVQEGIGDQGVHLIDWVDDDDDALHLALRRLRSAGQTSAAWHLMEGGWSEAEARTYLEEMIFGQPAWVEGRIRFAKHPFRGPFIASYWFGDEAVREVRERSGAQREAFIEFLYGQMNTPESLRMFPSV